jgi:putative glycerol-1-phosphate prenyltransferase
MKFKFADIVAKNKAALAVLIDPDKFDKGLVKMIDHSKTAFILVGGSKLKKGNIKETVKQIKKITKLPVILFPGDESQLCKEADGLFVLSLLSGRNPEYLIDKQIRAAQIIKKLGLKTFPVAYILVGTGGISETEKVTKTKPLKELTWIVDTALAAEHLGFKAVYLEAGSGSKKQVNDELIKAVSKSITIPLIVGGGISSAQNMKRAKKAGANVIVVGNSLEKDKSLITEFSKVFE